LRDKDFKLIKQVDIDATPSKIRKPVETVEDIPAFNKQVTSKK